MVRYNISRYIATIVIVSIAFFWAISYLHNNLSFNSLESAWGDITTTVTIVTILCTLFVSWAWRWRIFQGWLVPFPCLSGKWKGYLFSTYKPDDEPIPIEITIKHHFFNVQIKISTGESRSVSTCASFDIDKDRGLNQLYYSYQNTPNAKIRDRSEIHYGTTRLEISDDSKTLEGEYWTSRKTTGDIKVSKVS